VTFRGQQPQQAQGDLSMPTGHQDVHGVSLRVGPIPSRPRIVLWTAGVGASRLAAALPPRPAPRSTGPAGSRWSRDLTLRGHPEVLALGDMRSGR
jgi:NADH dehydrogenase FAD-containing subunit